MSGVTSLAKMGSLYDLTVVYTHLTLMKDTSLYPINVYCKPFQMRHWVSDQMLQKTPSYNMYKAFTVELENSVAGTLMARLPRLFRTPS